MTLTPSDFTMFSPLTDYVKQRIWSYKFEHVELEPGEHSQVILDCVKAIHERDMPAAGAHRKPDWEKGWSENEAAFSPAKAGRELAKPRYHGKYPHVRWKDRFYRAISEDYEHNMLAVIQDYVLDKYFRDQDIVYEFGCGTGHNLFRVHDVNPKCELFGLDWADSAWRFINLQASAGAYGWHPTDTEQEPFAPLATGLPFDFFNPTWDMKLHYGCGVYTVAALEQVGPRFHAWLQYILEQKPAVVAHVEPIGEVLDPSILNDYLSLEYFKKRGYLSGYLDYLQLLNRAGKLHIHEVNRTKIGSKFIEGYTIIVWKPLL